ncbi:MAG: AraC family transcriptional regulator [Saprospiraceae bacterium]
MVSLRCKALVHEELEKLGLKHTVLDFGIVEIQDVLTTKKRAQLKETLRQSGWELLDNKKSRLIEQIKHLIIERIRADKSTEVSYADYISKKLGYEYNYLANLFAEVQAITIQQFIILEKIERIKELLFYEGPSLKEIANQLHYSSVAQLSGQFKKITGLSPSFYQQLRKNRTRALQKE